MIDEVKAAVGDNGRETNTALTAEIAATKAEWLAEWAPLLTSDETPINPYRVVNEINKTLDHANSVVTHDAGNPRDQIMPFYKATVPHGYIGWGKTTHLGYGIPLAMGSKMANPDKFCMNFMGDLAFGHTGTEIETAVRRRFRSRASSSTTARWADTTKTCRSRWSATAPAIRAETMPALPAPSARRRST